MMSVPLKHTELRIYVDHPTRINDAQELAKRLSRRFLVSIIDSTLTSQDACTVRDDAQQIPKSNLNLHLTHNNIFLEQNNMVLSHHFTDMRSRLKPHNLEKEILIRAIRIKGKSPNKINVLDATAGLGRDSLLLAAAGFHVTMIERDPLIAALLHDALDHARQPSDTKHSEVNHESDLARITQHLSLIEGDSIEFLQEGALSSDVVYLDPMFPSRQKRAAVKKNFQILHIIEPPGGDEYDLFAAARMSNPQKIVVKRPLKAPWLAEEKPNYSLKGKMIRYDCYVNVSPPCLS